MLYTTLPQDIKDVIQSIFINVNSTDMLIWEASTNGKYSTKSGYHCLANLKI